MKNALIAFDKFKDALTALEACHVAAEALREAQPNWEIATSPLADGGDGFCDTLTRLCDGIFCETEVHGPVGEPAIARYGIVETSKISPSAAERLNLPAGTKTLAIVEFAQSSGIALVPPEKRSPWDTTSYGLGESLKHAIGSKADAVLIGLGGSATNDLALGALQAFGFSFLDADGASITEPLTPQIWSKVVRVTAPESAFPFPVRIACDVVNPLLGSNGATAIFGPQKGLKSTDFSRLESEMQRLANLLCDATSTSIQSMDTPGAGAAGGAAFGLMLGLGGELTPGAELVFDWSSLDEKWQKADLVITGEGRFDASSLQGKGPGSLATLSIEGGKELLILAGSLGDLPRADLGTFAQAISPKHLPLPEALAATADNIRAAIKRNFEK